MESAACLSPLSRRRIKALGDVAAYLSERRAIPGQRVAVTVHRSLDLHGRVYVNDGSVCIVRSTSLRAAARWACIAVVSQVIVLTASWPIRAAALVVLCVAICSASSAIEAARQARRFVQPPTHVLSDLVRFRHDRRGSGAALAEELLDLATERRWLLGGTAANVTLLRRFYLPHGWLPAGDLLFRSPLPGR